MAFQARSLCLYNSVPYGSGGARVDFFNYATADAAATVIAAGYFNAARAKLKVNDVITAMTSAGGTGDVLQLRVTAVPASGDIAVVVDGEASGS